MSNKKINIQEIFENYGVPLYAAGFDGFQKNIKAAIKEIIENVIILCAEKAETKWEPDVKVRKSSILNVKTLISYE